MKDTKITTVDLRDSDAGLIIGGKAAGLRRLATAGLPIPPGLVIPAEVDDQELPAIASAIADRFSGDTLAVRSSADAEDLATESFAGQYQTVLNVPAESAAIAAAARSVRASAQTERVGSYGTSHSTQMAVLVMPMVSADSAGVAFTRDPVSGERCVLVEAVTGLGDRLASGEAVGERWRITGAVSRVNDLGVLSSDQASDVADLARRCEAALGSPQDIEWAIKDHEVLLLQSRPITTVNDVEPIPMNDQAPPGPWEWDSAHNRLPITPLTASVFIPGFERGSRWLAEIYGVPISHLAMRVINGYLYIQVVPPAGKPGQPSPPKLVMRSLFHVLPLLRRRMKAARRAITEGVDERLLAQWRHSVRPSTESTLSDWLYLDRTELSDPELSDLIMESAKLQRETFCWNMITDPAYLLPLAALHDFVESELDGGMDMTTTLLQGSSPSEYYASATALAAGLTSDVREAVASGGGIDSLNPGSGAAFRVHQRAHGTKIIGFDLSAPTYLEDPDRELARIATMTPRRDPAGDAQELAATLSAALGAERAARFDVLLAQARAAFPIREEGEAVHGRVMGMVRLFALEAGDRMVAAGTLQDREHVVFLNLEEVVNWLDSPSDLMGIVRQRRGNHLWAAGRSPEPYLGTEIPMPPPDIFPPDVQHIMRVQELIITYDMRPTAQATGVDGVAASPGVHTGPARLVTHPQEFDKVQPGDVLIAPISTSAWEILFPQVGALVTEGGGLLSHPAIVAREYALPAVVGCEGAMTRFHDGQLVRVDGAAGTVTAVEE